MLSERGLQIVEKLIENNRIPITSKTLALYLGVSERSVKTYIKEVSDFCAENGMLLDRKPGIGFVANFTNEQIDGIAKLKKDKKIVMSQKQRMSYIMYILLSGWDTYTLSLFSEELNVSKKVIGDDIDTISKEFSKYKIKINRVAGHGVFITGDEFSIRRAMKSYCQYEIGTKTVEKSHDYRVSADEEELWINNFGQDNVEYAIQIIKDIEKINNYAYTDYSFKMLVEYLSIQMFRLRMGNEISEDIIGSESAISPRNAVEFVAGKVGEKVKTEINNYEKEYIDILLASAAIQNKDGEAESWATEKDRAQIDRISDEMLMYLSELLNADMSENQLLKTSLKSFIPASMVRTKFGIEVRNPFLSDIREMYSGIFATCFTLSKFYEQYCDAIPTDHEISFLALFVGGALHRNVKTVNAVLVGTNGMAATNIVAGKIQQKIEDVKIVSIITSEKLDAIEDYECDIILSMLDGFEYGNKVVHISPVISKTDEKNIKDKCFEILSHPDLEKEGFSNIIDMNYIQIIREKVSKEDILRDACRKLHAGGYVTKSFIGDVLSREKIEPTAIGSGVAIPHGMPENVVEPKVSVTKLMRPINWGGKMVDLIFVLALNFNNISTTKAFFHDFARILGNDEKIKNIKESKDIYEMERRLKEELHWN